ncbi:MAG: two-component system sensor histidine kinase NtrB [Bacillota bacterium]
MNIDAYFKKITNSNRWMSFIESTAKGLQVNLSFLLSDGRLIEAPNSCPICLIPYSPLTNGDIDRVLKLANGDTDHIITIKGHEAIILLTDGGIPFIVRDCEACTETGVLSLEKRALIAKKLINSFYTALAEGFQGGNRAIELSTLRHMNHIILSLFQGKEDAAERSFDLILSALIIILDAQGSWLELYDHSTHQTIYKGDKQAVINYLNSGQGSPGFSVEVSTNEIKGRLGVLAPVLIDQAMELLPLMAQEVAIVVEIDNLFRLFHKRMIRVLEAIDSGIVVLDKKRTVSYVNLPFEQLMGISTIDIVGKSDAFINGPWTPYIKSGIDQQIEGKVEVLNLLKKQICIDWQVSPLIEDKSVQGWIIFIKDRTDYYRWQEEVRKAERLANTTAMVGSLAHELRNPLSAAKGLLQLTRQKGDTHGSGGYIDLVQKEIDRVTTLLNEFLLLGKPAEKLEEPVQLSSLLRELVPILESEAFNYGSELIIDIQSEPFLRADPGQLTQVIMNLVRNAAQAAGEQGKIFVSLHEKGQKVFITIWDTGPGIDPAIMDNLFRPFFTTKERGTGLGLSIVQAIIHNHGGDIVVKNAQEGGAIFQAILPSYINVTSIQVDVLMIVKDRMIKYPSEQAVREAGLNIITADSLEQGIGLLENFPPKILVIDNCFLDHKDNLKLFKQHSKNSKIVIIGEPCLPDILEDAAYISKNPLNYTRLVSQLKLGLTRVIEQ